MPTHRLIAPLLALACLCAGCPHTDPPSASAPAPVTAQPAVVALPEARDVVVEGEYVSPRTGLAYPLELGEFVRVDLAEYDRDGYDLSAGYDLYREGAPRIPGTSLAALTAYVYPSTRDRGVEFAGILSEIESAGYPQLAVVENGEAEIAVGDGRITARFARYGFKRMSMIGPLDAFTDTWLYSMERKGIRWSVKFRVTYYASDLETLRPKIAACIRDLDLR